jgi:hypothetical protein
MTDSRVWIWVRWKWTDVRDKVLRWIVWRLPKSIVYWAAIRVVANATTGPYESQIVPELRAMDALDRWEKP